MTVAERIRSAVKTADMDIDNVEKLIYVAYYMGREDAAKEICDEVRDILAGQKIRAAECRYHEMAMAVQGGISMVKSDDYSGDITNTFGNDTTEI